MRRFLSISLLGALCLTSLPGHSQAGNRPVTVSGDVLSAEGNHRVEGASVTVTDSGENQIEQLYTNSAGIFRVVGLRRAQYLLKVSTKGYHHVDLSFSSDRGITIYLQSSCTGLKNPWGITRSRSGSPWWVSNNNSGTSTLYDGGGNPISGRECRLIRFQVMRLSRK